MTTLSEWKLSSEDGKVDCPLPYTMLFIGRADCDINMEAETIDKRHALITFDHYQNKFKVKDLGTANGTYINDRRIPDQTFITIEDGDAIQLGRDCTPLQVGKSLLPATIPTTAVLSAATQCHAIERPPLPTSHSIERPRLPTSHSIEKPPLPTSHFIERPPLPTSHSIERPPLPTSHSIERPPLPTSHSIERPPLPTSHSIERPPLPTSHSIERPPLPTSHSIERPPLPTSHSIERPPLPSSNSIERPPLTTSHSLDRVYTTTSSSSSSQSVDDISQPTRSSSRPLWDRRPYIAECQGCIREQDLYHTCGTNSELSLASHAIDTEEGVRASPVSPLNLRNQRQSPKSTSQSYFHSFAAQDEIDTYNRSTDKDKEVIGAGGEVMTSCLANTHNNLTDNIAAAKRGTPLYGQPSWWGESGADEHNKQLLQDMQRLMEEDKQHCKEVEEDRNHVNSTAVEKPSIPSVDTGADTSKGLSFTVDLADSLEEKSIKAELTDPRSSGDKLSNFLPENLRKSFRERREKLTQSAERNSSENSPAMPRRSKSPSRAAGCRDSNSDKPAMFLINKMFHSSSKTSDIGHADDQTEYSMYSEAKGLNRSSTMPELKHTQATTDLKMTKSRTSDSLLVDDNEDKVSESGTYTIDEDNKELEKAREDIDRLFGVVDKVSLGSPSLEIVESAEDALEVNGSMQVEVGSGQVGSGQVDVEETISTAMKEKGSSSQELLHQLATTDSPTFHNNNDILAGKPPLSPTRALEQRDNSPIQRARRLPAVPRTGKRADELRHSTEVTIGKSNTMPKRRKDVQYSKEKILQELGIGETPVIQTERPKLVEELLTSRTYHKDNDPIIINKTTFFDKIISSTSLPSPEQSKEMPQYSTPDVAGKEQRSSMVGRQSVDSVNTDVLLQSTDEFMKAIHSFSSESEASGRPGNGAKTSASASKSTTKQSNSLRKSTADRLSAHNKLNNGGGGDMSTPRKPTASKDPTRRSVSDSVTSRLSGPKRSQSRDSENGGSQESLNNSKSVSGSKVGPLSSSRSNRTFELRRARTESVESETSVGSTSRTNGSRTSGRSARSLDNTEVSLGARIVQKSREAGAVMDAPKSTPLRRNDGGRYSMRAMSTTNKTTGAKSNTAATSKQTSGKKLPSRPSSNSMIAKAEREKEAGKEREKAAWDRRRTYDPRRAVQEAKAKKADSRGGTPSSATEESSACSSSRPRANSYSGANTNHPADAPTTDYNSHSDTRHSADVLHAVDSESLKLNLEQENVMEDSHELEIAQLSHNLAKDLELLSTTDSEQPDRYKSVGSAEKICEPSPETEELIESMFACQQQRSAFSSYRSAASVTPETASPALSPMKKKLSTSQQFDNGSSNNIDHVNSYNSLVLTSIQRLSAKLQNYTCNTVGRLREKGLSLSASPSPTEEMRGDDMPANTTLASILKTLKNVEHNCKVMDKALFTSSVPQSDLSTVSNNEHEHYLAEIKRIRNEIAGFRPIEDTTKDSTKASTTKPTSKLSNNNNNTKPAVSKSRTNPGTSSYKQRPVYY